MINQAPNKCQVNESSNVLGKGKCRNDDECKGNRKCQNNLCIGEDGCDKRATKKSCLIEEGKGVYGFGRCASDAECKGNRVCN